MAKPTHKPAPQAARRPPPAPPRKPAPPAPARTAAPQRPSDEDDRRPATARASVPAPKTSQAPAHLRQRMAQDAGKGVSKDQSDNLIPLIYILQELSPQCNPREPKYIEGALAGMIWLRGMDPPVFDGEQDGIVVQSCTFNKCVNEWIPRDDGGGFVGRHKSMPDDAVRTEDPNDPNKVSWRNPNGNQYIETREHVCIVHLPDGRRVPYVLPFSSTGHSVSRGWMFAMNQKTLDGETVPSFAFKYRLKTQYNKNKKGAWFGIVVSDEGWASEDEYNEGLALYEAFTSGAKDVDAGQYGDAGNEDGDGSSGQTGDDGDPI